MTSSEDTNYTIWRDKIMAMMSKVPKTPIFLLVSGYVRRHNKVAVNDISHEVILFSIGLNIGLSNLGMTGWIGAVFSCLSNIPFGFREYFISNAYKKDVNTTNPLGWQGQVATEYANLIKQIWNSDTKEIEPIEFLEMLSNVAPRFSNAPNDASEFLSFILDALHEDLNLVINKPSTNPIKSNGHQQDEVMAGLSWINFKKRNESKIVDIFMGQFKSQIDCMQCYKKTVRFDPFMAVSVEPRKSRTIYDCLDNYVAQSNEVFFCECSHPESMSHCFHKIDIWSPPRILTIVIKKWQIRKFIKYPIRNLNLSKYVMSYDELDDVAVDAPIYDLLAVICHKLTENGGYYYSVVKNMDDGTFYVYEDEEVRFASKEEIVSPNAYILMYKKRINTIKQRETIQSDINCSERSDTMKYNQYQLIIAVLFVAIIVGIINQFL